MVLSSGCLGPEIKHRLCYGLLLKHLKSPEKHWLHPDLTAWELTQRYEQRHLEAEWRSALPHGGFQADVCAAACDVTCFLQIRPED